MAATYEAIIALVGQMDPSLKKVTDQAKKELEALEKKATKSGKGLGKDSVMGKALKGLGSLAKKSMKAVAAGTAAAATGVAVLAKQSLDSYAQYEQLVGGVDTLFKGSSQRVQDYANAAYKTAGISANSYMETVTSFAASLVNSLGGDTQKAAELGNMAITDMSDNANKMGTDMSMLQNTYQSLARGNWGMLDNLKLGYGGTKAEGERLLNDANKILAEQGKAANLTKGNFADLVKAIHLVQENMGITGTTALEAATTIEGSVNSMKAAWQNWLTGLANEDADLGILTDQLLDSVSTAASNIMPRIQTILTRMGSWFAQSGPGIIQQLASGIASAAPQLLATAGSVLMSLAQGIVAAAPTLLSVGFQLILMIATGVMQNIPQVISLAVQLIGQFAQACAAYLPILIPIGVQAILNFIMGLAQNLPTIAAYAGQILIALAQGIANSIPLIVEQGPVIMASLVRGIIGAAGELLSAGWQIVQILGSAVLDGLANIGSMIGDFFVGLFTGQEVEVPAEIGDVDTSNVTGANLPTLDTDAQITEFDTSFLSGANLPAVDTSAQITEFDTSAIEGVDIPEIEVPPVEIPEVDTSSLDAISNFQMPTIDTSGLSGMTADYSGIVSGAEEAKSQVVSVFAGMGGEITNAVSSGLGGVSYDPVVTGATTANDQVVQAFSATGQSIATAISSGTAGAGNSFATITTSAQASAASTQAAYVGVGASISSSITSALSGATGGFASFTSAGTSSAMQVRSAQASAAMMVMSLWSMALAMVSARAYATVGAFYAMSAAGTSAAYAISGSMSGVAGNISSITSAAYAAVGALNAMASAARSASAAAASASAARAVGFAHGGFTSGPSVAGEDPRYPTEAVISFNPAYRAANKGYVMRAAQMLGMSSRAVTEKDPWTLGGELANSGAPITSNYEMSTTVNVGGITFAPQIEIKGNASRDDIVAALRKVEPEFGELVRDVLAEGEVGDYAFDAT